MTKQTAPSRVNAQISDLPIARLDVQDLEQSLPIREYLEQNGVAVVINRAPSINEAYYIICGDAFFVKDRAASVPQQSTRPFAVLFLGNKEKFPESLSGTYAKIAAISGAAISTRDVPRLFAYFFTGDEETFYLGKDTPPPVELKPIEGEKPHPEQEESFIPDADRVSRAIGEMFGEKTREDRKTIRQKDRKKKITPGRVALIIVCFLVAPIVWYFVSLAMIVAIQWYGVKAITRGDVSRMTTVAGVTTYWVGQGGGALALVGLPAKIFGAGSVIRSQERVLSVASDIVIAENKVAELTRESSRMVPILFARPEERSGSEVSLSVAIDRVRLALDGLTSALGLAGAQLHIIATNDQFPFTIPIIRDMTRRADAGIGAALAQAGQLRNLLTLYRAAGGFDEKKTYLIILQNSMELRPTGGFIGSVATVTVEDGAIATPIVQDVYTLDGQLKGHVDPPGPVKELLAQEHWYLRDSNWDPDFRVSGERAAWFYQKETGQSVDGVIAISTPIITDLLGVTGPLDLPDYNDRITKENFFGKSLFYTKADFFPGSTQKKDFLGSLMVALLNRFTSGAPGDPPALMRVGGRALAAGDIQFWFPKREVQMIAEQSGWAGEVARPVPCQTLSPSCMVNRVALVESNMGVNKVNSFVKRSVKSRMDVDEDGGIDGTIAIAYQNTSTDDAMLSGGGVYLTYLRVVLPADALVLSTVLDGAEIPGKAAKAAERTIPYRDTDEITRGSMIAGVAFTVPPGMERTATITYRRGVPLTFTDGESTLVFSVRKQPGITDTTLSAAIGYPAGWKLETDRTSGSEDASTGFLANVREVRYNTALDQTKVFTVRFRK